MINALILSCTLKPSPEPSNTEAMAAKLMNRFTVHGIKSELIRIVDYDIKPGTESDMGDGDQWPEILKKLKAADILIIATPIWMGHMCSVTQRVMERIDAVFSEEGLADKQGRYYTYGKVAGCLVTGNEDGAQEVVGEVLWAMQEFGFTVPANANAFWIGAAGNRKDYIPMGGERDAHTNSVIMTMGDNIAHLARVLKEHPYPTDVTGNQEAAEKPE